MEPESLGHPRITSRRTERPFTPFQNLIDIDDLRASIAADGRDELHVDLSRIRRLADGTPVDPARLYGRIYTGPFPFEAAESRAIYRFPGHPSAIIAGRSSIPVGDFFQPRYNSEDWKSGGALSVRFELFLEQTGAPDRWLGVYDLLIRAHREPDFTIALRPAIIEGPLISHPAPGQSADVIISFLLDEASWARVVINDGPSFESTSARGHQVRLTDLQPGVEYRYRVELPDGYSFPERRFRTPPPPGKGAVRFVYFGDTRQGFDEGPGVGDRAVMGVNKDMTERITLLAAQDDPDFVLMGGDVGFGYTLQSRDLALQFHAFKQAALSLWSERPFYMVMGNHDAVVDLYDDTHRHGIRLDKRPYDSNSSEAAFADAFYNPANGPKPADPRRPPYAETVYSVRHGPLMIITINTNYWMSNQVDRFGGSPEGYLLPDQLNWVLGELDRAAVDPSVECILIVGHEPVFPNGGHVADAMWWNGDNSVTARQAQADGTLAPMGPGILDTRDRLIAAASVNPKVAAMLSADEHSYHKLWMTRDVPIRDVPTREPSPITRPLWFISSAGGGASYYAEETTPWNTYWKSMKKNGKGSDNKYYYSSQPHYILFDYSERSLSMKVVSAYGDEIDSVENLYHYKGK